MNDRPRKRSTLDNLRQAYKLPERNADFSLLKSLPVSLGWGLAYGFVFYWMSKIMEGTEASNYSMGFAGIIAGTISTLIFDRWKIGWALDEMVNPVLMLIVFIATWYVVK